VGQSNPVARMHEPTTHSRKIDTRREGEEVLVHLPGVGEIRYRPLDLDIDLPYLHAWFNQDYARYWGLQGKTREEIGAIYARKQARAGYDIDMAVWGDSGERLCLIEAYDVARDPLRHHYDHRPGDCGHHVFMAPGGRVMAGLTYFVFVANQAFMFSDPARQRIVCEPDITNHKALMRFHQAGYRPLRVAHLQYKTAQLVHLPRERHVASDPLSPPALLPIPHYRLWSGTHAFMGRVIRKLRHLRAGGAA
jgi:Acetyltransferase (GNAT) domain